MVRESVGFPISLPNTVWDEAISNHSTSGSFANGMDRLSSKTVTFTGASGLGASATNTVWFTQSGGLILVKYIAGRCTTTLTGANATLTLGVIGSTALFIAATTATTLIAGTSDIWVSTTATLGGIVETASDVSEVINGNIVSAVATANITGGVLELNVIWVPLTPGATLV